MAELHLPIGLVTKGAELTTMLEAPSGQGSTIDDRPRRNRLGVASIKARYRARGDQTKAVVAAACQIVRIVLAKRSLNTADKGLAKTVMKCVCGSLHHYRTKGLLRSIKALDNCILGVRYPA